LRKALIFLASMIPVLMFGGYAILSLRSQYVSNPTALESAVELATIQLFESPGDWNATPPVAGLALTEGPENFTLIWPYVVDPVKLQNLSSMSYEDMRRSLVAAGLDVRIAFYAYNSTEGRFEIDPILTLGTPVLRESVLSRVVYVYLAGDVTINGVTLNEGFYKVVVTVTG